MCGGGQRLDDITVYFIIGALSFLILLIMATVAAISVLLCLRKRKMELRKRKTEFELANTVTHHSYDNELDIIATATVNGNRVTTHRHTTRSTKESGNLKNEARFDTDITTYVNPAYNQVENTDDNSSQYPYYDYVRTVNMYNINVP